MVATQRAGLRRGVEAMATGVPVSEPEVTRAEEEEKEEGTKDEEAKEENDKADTDEAPAQPAGFRRRHGPALIDGRMVRRRDRDQARNEAANATKRKNDHAEHDPGAKPHDSDSDSERTRASTWKSTSDASPCLRAMRPVRARASHGFKASTIVAFE